MPRSAVLGLQVGVRATMASIGLGLAWAGPLAAGIALALLLGLPRLAPRLPVVPIALLAAVLADLAAGRILPPFPSPAFALPILVLPASLDEAWRGLVVGALPQLPLTIANAVLLPALLVHEMFPPAAAAQASERRLGLVTGAANAVLAPFGALPMCHGAGGLMAQHRLNRLDRLDPTPGQSRAALVTAAPHVVRGPGWPEPEPCDAELPTHIGRRHARNRADRAHARAQPSAQRGVR